MNRLTRLRPSPAMAIALIALFVALGGVGYAAATIGSAQIRNNSIRGKDMKNGSLTGKDVKKNGIGGVTVKESRLGSVPSAEALSHTAVVTALGQAVRGRGVTGAIRRSTGRYEVTFNRDVRSCVYSATIGDTSAAGPPDGEVTVTSLATNPNGVALRTAENNGTLANKPFHLIVSC